MRVILICPNYLIREYFGNPSDPPIGVASIASVLEKNGYVVNIIDADAENLNMEAIYSKVCKINPDVVAISCNYSPLHNPTLEIARMIKGAFDTTIIVGGNHATAMAEYMIEQSNGNIDFVVRGEGEVTMLNLLKAVQANAKLSDVSGIAYKDKETNTIVITKTAPLIDNLDDLPMPAYHLLPMDKYNRYNVISCRGCPYNCTFCASKVMFGHKVRCRSAKHVVDEIEHLISIYGRKQIWFSDDTFTTNSKYLNEFLDELVKKKWNIEWSCLTRVDKISKDLLLKMKKSGCIYISYGVESGNPKMLSQMNKKISLDVIKKTLQLTRQCGIRMYTFYLIGNFEESWDTIKDSYELIIETKPDGASFAIVIPLPKTRMWNDLVNRRIINHDTIQWDNFFAKIRGGSYANYPANLASKWCNLQPDELIKACKIGETLPLILHLGNDLSNLRSDDVNDILKLYSSTVSSHIKDKTIFVETVKMYLDIIKS